MWTQGALSPYLLCFFVEQTQWQPMLSLSNMSNIMAADSLVDDTYSPDTIQAKTQTQPQPWLSPGPLPTPQSL